MGLNHKLYWSDEEISLSPLPSVVLILFPPDSHIFYEFVVSAWLGVLFIIAEDK